MHLKIIVLYYKNEENKITYKGFISKVKANNNKVHLES